MNLLQSSFPEWYREIESLGDPLTGISDRIDFERIRPILSDLFMNDTEKGGRPNYDPLLMVKILLLQQWYNLSDPQIEREIRDQIMAKRIRIKKGTMQDASFIESDRGEYGKPRGEDANTRRSKDGTSATKNHEKHFGYMSHALVNEIKIIEKLSVTTANVHDSQIDLSMPGIICYRDKGYFGSECKGINGTMDRAVRGHKSPVRSIRRNLRISGIRSEVKHPFAFFKGMFHFFHVMVTSVQRVRVKTYLTAMCYNLMRSRYLDRIV